MVIYLIFVLLMFFPINKQNNFIAFFLSLHLR